MLPHEHDPVPRHLIGLMAFHRADVILYVIPRSRLASRVGKRSDRCMIQVPFGVPMPPIHVKKKHRAFILGTDKPSAPWFKTGLNH